MPKLLDTKLSKKEMKCVQTRLAVDALEQYGWINLCRLITPNKTRYKRDFFYFKDQNVTSSCEVYRTTSISSFFPFCISLKNSAHEKKTHVYAGLTNHRQKRHNYKQTYADDLATTST